ncbi:MAG: hydroxyacid dehydrogenase [Negativicutes bacterium]
MEKTVLLINPTIQPAGVDLLQKECRVVIAPNGTEETLIQYINQNQIQAVVTRVEKITRRIFENCPSLLLVGQHGVGVDNIDVTAATENGVLVLNVPAANYMSVAEHTIMAILALSRNLLVSDSKVRAAEWQFRDTFYPMEINGKTLLIVGLGRIGQEVARKAKAFNMCLLGYDPFVTVEDMALVGVKKIVDIGACVPEIDFLSIHVPLNAATKNLISAEILQRIKSTAYIINVGRGPVIDQHAIYEALKNKVIAGAALDVLREEPPQANEPLFELTNVIFTPHFAGDTREAKHRCSLTLASDVIKVLQGASSSSIVNPKALGAARLK